MGEEEEGSEKASKENQIFFYFCVRFNFHSKFIIMTNYFVFQFTTTKYSGGR